MSTSRDRILELLERDPGLHLRELPRRLDLSLRTVRYHLDVLARDEAVTCHRSGRFERWFPARRFSREDRAIISAWRAPGQRAILERLLLRGPATFAELRSSGLSRVSLVRSLDQLATDGIVFLDSERRYGLQDPGALRVRLGVYRTRFPDLLADAANEIFGETR